MKVLSLCDGMSCGHIALDRVGIKVHQYFAAEIKEIGIKVTKRDVILPCGNTTIWMK